MGISRKAQWVCIAALAVVIVGLLTVIGVQQTQRHQSAQQARNSAPVAQAEPTPTREAKPRVAFLGDSYTAGSGASDQSKRWSTLVSEEMGWEEFNFGFGGTNYATPGEVPGGTPYTERVDDVVESNPDMVIVSGGSNSLGTDQSQGIEQTFTELREQLPDAEIVALSPFWKAEALPYDLEVVADQVQEGVESVDGRYVELDNPLEGQPELLDDDGIHPNNAGYEHIAKEVQAAL